MVATLCRTDLAFRRIRLDRVRLSRRAYSVRLAMHQLAFWCARHLRFLQRPRVLLSGVVERERCAASFPALELGGQGRAGHRRVVLQQSGPRRTLPERAKPRRTNHAEEFPRRMESEIRARHA